MAIELGTKRCFGVIEVDRIELLYTNRFTKPTRKLFSLVHIYSATSAMCRIDTELYGEIFEICIPKISKLLLCASNLASLTRRIFKEKLHVIVFCIL